MSCKQKDITQLVESKIGNMIFTKEDVNNRPKTFKEYLVFSFPKEFPVDRAFNLEGVYKARRIYKDGEPLNRIIIVWKGSEPSSSTIFLSFGSFIPPSSIRPWVSSAVVYDCHGTHRVSKYCRRDSVWALC